MGEQLLRTEEVAQRLNISLATAYRWMKAGVIPVVRISGTRSVRVPESALEQWIKGNTVANADLSTR
jgi:excisionase family DNA binding protein